MPEPTQRQAFVRTLRGAASWRRRTLARPDGRNEFQKGYRAMTGIQTAAVFIESSMDDNDTDLPFLQLLPKRANGALELCPEANRVVGRFGIGPDLWEDGGPSEDDVRELIATVREAETKHRQRALPDSEAA